MIDDLWIEPAFRYELARRVFSSALPGFEELDEMGKRIVACAFGTEDQLGPTAIWQKPHPRTEPWWTPVCGLQFDLRKDDAEILGTFKQWIDELRVKTNTPSPARGKGGSISRRREPSKEWLRLLDLNGKVLTDAERSKKSVAMREARKWLPELEKVASMLVDPQLRTPPFPGAHIYFVGREGKSGVVIVGWVDPRESN